MNWKDQLRHAHSRCRLRSWRRRVLAAELVGASGEVIGADRSAAAVEWAVARAQASPDEQREISRRRPGRYGL